MKKIALAIATVFVAFIAMFGGTNAAVADGPDGLKDPTPCTVTEWEFINEAPIGTTRPNVTDQWLAQWCVDQAITKFPGYWWYDQPNGNVTMAYWEKDNGPCDCFRLEKKLWNVTLERN